MAAGRGAVNVAVLHGADPSLCQGSVSSLAAQGPHLCY